MTEKEEQAYIEGQKSIWRRQLSEVLRLLGLDDPAANAARWAVERADTVACLRELCGEFGDTEWDDSLHLTDVIEKHLWRHIEPLLPDPEDK